MTRVGFSGKGGVSEAEVAALIATHAGVSAAHHTKTTAAGDIVSGTFGAAMLGVLKKYVIGDDLLHSHDAEANNQAGSFTKMKTITLDVLYPDPVTLRIKFDLKSQGSNTCRGRIYKNGGAAGTERSRSSETYETFTQDIEYADGDTLELYGHKGTATGVYVRNFRVYGAEEYQTFAEALAAADVGKADPFQGTNS